MSESYQVLGARRVAYVVCCDRKTWGFVTHSISIACALSITAVFKVICSLSVMFAYVLLLTLIGFTMSWVLTSIVCCLGSFWGAFGGNLANTVRAWLVVVPIR